MIDNPPAPAPAAMSAFLRGVERRAWLFVELHRGDVATLPDALQGAFAAYATQAARCPVATWPRLFWSALLAAPVLRDDAAGCRREAPFTALQGLGRGPRAALLLGLVAQLPEDDAAAVLGVSVPAYELAVRRALAGIDGDRSEADTWRDLALAVRDALRALTPQRLVALTRLREAVLSGRLASAPQPPSPQHPRRAAATRQRWSWALPWVLAAVVVAVSIVGYLRWSAVGGGTRAVALPPVEAPAARFDAEMAVLSHPDFEQLVDARDPAIVADPGFYAWYAAQPADTAAAKATGTAQHAGSMLDTAAGTDSAPEAADVAN